MIKKIKTINNLAVFDNFDWDKCVQDKKGQSLSFEKLNILYGRNYSGKTTLSRIFRTLETHQLPEKYENPQFEIVLDDDSRITQATIGSATVNVRVFNEDFVRTNLRFLIDPDGEIAPFAILGADNAKIEMAIKDLETEIGSETEGQETGLYKKLNDDKIIAQKARKAFESANSALENKLSEKAINRQSGIKYNASRFGDQNYTIAKIKQEIGVVTAQGYSALTPEMRAEHNNTIMEQTKPEIPAISAPDVNIRTFFGKAAELLSRKIGTSNKIAELLHDAALNEWVKKGKSLLSGKDICAFCGNPISIARWEEINAHFDEESKKLEAEIDALLSEMDSEKARLQAPLNIDKTAFYSKYSSIVDTFTNATSEAIQQYCAALDSVITQLQARKAHITITSLFEEPSEKSAALKKLFEDFSKTIKENNEFSSKLLVAKTIAQRALRLQEVSDFCATVGYASEMANISDLKTESDAAVKAFENTESLLKITTQKLKAKLRQLNDEEEGARRVNDYLNDYFGHRFVALEADEVMEGEKRIRFQIMRNGRPAFNLSGGECSLISFCYFMAKLDDIDTNGKKPIIWIDDPISSLDGNHVFFVYTLLRAGIVESGKYEQLFISTHNLDFLKYLKRLSGKDNDKRIRYFLIQREDKSSTILPMPNYLQRYVTEFNYLFHEIYKSSQIITVNDSNYMSFYNFGNNARKFLEILMFYNYPDDTTQIDKLERFFGEGRVPALLTDRINNEYSHLCGLFERGETPTEVPEMLTTAKLIIETVKNRNPEQYFALMQSIGEPIAN